MLIGSFKQCCFIVMVTKKFLIVSCMNCNIIEWCVYLNLNLSTVNIDRELSSLTALVYNLIRSEHDSLGNISNYVLPNVCCFETCVHYPPGVVDIGATLTPYRQQSEPSDDYLPSMKLCILLGA